MTSECPVLCLLASISPCPSPAFILLLSLFHSHTGTFCLSCYWHGPVLTSARQCNLSKKGCSSFCSAAISKSHFNSVGVGSRLPSVFTACGQCVSSGLMPRSGWGWWQEEAVKPRSPAARSANRHPQRSARAPAREPVFVDVLLKLHSLTTLVSQRKLNFSWINTQCCQNWRFWSIRMGHLVCWRSRFLGAAGWPEENPATTGNILVLPQLLSVWSDLQGFICELQPQQHGLDGTPGTRG